MKAGFKKLIQEANESVTTRSIEEAKALVGNDDVLFVDIREAEELAGGKIPGAVHAPRGMLEFYVDPESPYHREEFASGKKIVLYCASGGRSALAAQTVEQMGLDNVSHLGGGFKEWVAAGGPTES